MTYIKKGYRKTLTKIHKKKLSEANKGEKSYLWKGGKQTNKWGYVLIKAHNHPFRNSKNCVFEHRLVMEKILGRYLEKNELVHHKNGINNDNRPENLEVVMRNFHFGIIKCPHCLKEFKVK